VRLAADQSGPPDGRPIVLLHGLTMTRRQVLNNTRSLERRGYRVIAYDMRGHGASDPPDDPSDYAYASLVADLVSVMDRFDAPRAVLVGNSIGSHTAVRLALDEPSRVAGLVLVTPAYGPLEFPSAENAAEGQALASALRERGLDGFESALRIPPGLSPDSTEVRAGHRQARKLMESHRDLGAVADALEASLSTRPFASFSELAGVAVPCVVVASRDQFDVRHPFALGRRWADAIPGAEFVTEEPGRVPVAWGGRELARVVGELADRAAWEPAAVP
jgi:pimeloyl-ACP methyl ester carboxylesterase